MRARSLSASFVAAFGIALGVGIQAAQATELTVDGSTSSAASAHISRQAIGALDARWNAEAAYYMVKAKKSHTATTLGPYLGRH